jgi:hypothetical protein
MWRFHSQTSNILIIYPTKILRFPSQNCFFEKKVRNSVSRNNIICAEAPRYYGTIDIFSTLRQGYIITKVITIPLSLYHPAFFWGQIFTTWQQKKFWYDLYKGPLWKKSVKVGRFRGIYLLFFVESPYLDNRFQHSAKIEQDSKFFVLPSLSSVATSQNWKENKGCVILWPCHLH